LASAKGGSTQTRRHFSLLVRPGEEDATDKSDANGDDALDDAVAQLLHMLEAHPLLELVRLLRIRHPRLWWRWSGSRVGSALSDAGLSG